MPKKGSHGEPWESRISEDEGEGRASNNVYGLRVDGKSLFYVGTFYCAEYLLLAVDCVNALDGRKPGGLDRLLVLLRELGDGSKWWCPVCQGIVPPEEVTFEEVHEGCGTYLGENLWVESVRAALAEFEGESEECKS